MIFIKEELIIRIGTDYDTIQITNCKYTEDIVRVIEYMKNK